MATKRFSLLALMGTLLLGACGQQTATTTAAQPVTAPAATQAAGHGLYEVHISTVNGQPNASVTRAGGGQLRAQELGGLSFSASAAATTTDATSKHYAVAITVTNNSGKDINQPLYVPVAVSGYTQNNTYFSSAQDSSGAATDPTGVTLEQADANTPLVNTNVSSSLISAPGAVTAVSPQAWQAPTLPSGGSQTVTFGFSIPLSNATNSFNAVFSVFATPKVNHLVVSQVFGGGGNTGAPYANDFIEIFNPTNGDYDLSTYAVQGFTSAGNSNGKLTLSGTLKPGQYYLVSANSNAAIGAALPTPDADASKIISLSNSNAAVSLLNGTTAIDTVGYGTANKFETKAVKALSNTTAALRNSGGCTDTDNNSTDFTVGAPAPRNSATTTNLCQ